MNKFNTLIFGTILLSGFVGRSIIVQDLQVGVIDMHLNEFKKILFSSVHCIFDKARRIKRN